eukprot:TRINITY_DN6514_c1_g1_i1.p1 TRINITY_DN6514_c1_g1~~TRINITY_DN6514_c1_g1_i1.p1  ORF type:complete len:62 (+),score=9.54 TRINITY_DN6514_c1_g1_i1:496-681(+)
MRIELEDIELLKGEEILSLKKQLLETESLLHLQLKELTTNLELARADVGKEKKIIEDIVED